MAAKGRKHSWLFALAALFASSAAFASIPKPDNLLQPSIDRFTFARGALTEEPTGNDQHLENRALLRSALESAIPPPEPLALLAETHVGASEFFVPLFPQEPDELSLDLRQAYLDLSAGRVSEMTFAGGDPVNGRDPTGRAGDPRAKAAQLIGFAHGVIGRVGWVLDPGRATREREEDDLRNTAKILAHRMRQQGKVVTPDTPVFRNALVTLDASGRVTRTPGAIEDTTADMVLTATGLKMASPAIASAYRTSGAGTASLVVADELVGNVIGVNPSLPLAVSGRRVEDFFGAAQRQRAATRASLGVSDQVADHAVLMSIHRDVFFAVHPELRGKVWVHHAIEKQAINKHYPGLFAPGEIEVYSNYRGIPTDINSDIHLSKIRLEWNDFYRAHPSATREQVLEKVMDVDVKYGHLFDPPLE